MDSNILLVVLQTCWQVCIIISSSTKLSLFFGLSVQRTISYRYTYITSELCSKCEPSPFTTTPYPPQIMICCTVTVHSGLHLCSFVLLTLYFSAVFPFTAWLFLLFVLLTLYFFAVFPFTSLLLSFVVLLTLDKRVHCMPNSKQTKMAAFSRIWRNLNYITSGKIQILLC